MSYLASDLQETQDLQQQVQNSSYQFDGPGFFTGMADLNAAKNSIKRGLFAEPAIELSLAGSNIPRAIDAIAGTETTAWWHQHTTDEAVKFRDSLKIDPQTHGMAAQILDSLGSIIPQAILAGPVGVGALTGIADTTEQIQAGKPLDVASELGATTGLTNAIGVAMPAAGALKSISINPLTQRIVSGVVGNMAVGAGTDAAKQKILDSNGYQNEADQYNWADPQRRFIDAVMGAAFGGLTHIQAKGVDIKPSDADAALVLNEAHALQTPDGISATNPAANNALVDGMNSAIEALREGKPVTASMPRTEDLVMPADNPLHEAISRQVQHSEGERFAERTGRAYDSSSNYTDGTAHLLPGVLDFYDKHVAHLPAKGSDLMPDALFRIGEVSDSVAAGLHDFLPGFNDSLREARISAQAIKHIHDSRQNIAKDVLAKLEAGVLRADEVLPNPQNRDRALLVVKDIGHKDANKRGVTVLEVAANGKGIDIVTSMTGTERSLKKAREFKQELELSRSEGQQLGQNPNSPHRHLPGQDQTHAAADFLHFERDNKSIDQQNKKATTPDTPEVAAARETLKTPSDREFTITHDDGSEDTGTAADLMARADADIAFSKQADIATHAAITCFLRLGF